MNSMARGGLSVSSIDTGSQAAFTRLLSPITTEAMWQLTLAGTPPNVMLLPILLIGSEEGEKEINVIVHLVCVP